jgi:deoxynucleoside triphosphate triphosphohydrolase SAMHD1
MPKLIFDPIHKFIEINDKCLKIIDTPEFQRLRNIKQLGACEYVFPGATHNRFSHSLGVFYLASKLINNLKNNQPELNISDDDIECVEIAGLCHDLGHGPFSHCFDNHCVNNLDTNLKFHEYRSCEILKLISIKYNIKLNLKKINNMIIPPENNKNFLYNIVCNNISGIDVDKFDYIARDTYFTGLDYSFDCSRILKYCKVIENELCFSEKLAFNIYELFRIRYRLHKEIYNHPVVSSIEFMISDYLKQLNIKLNKIEDFCKLDDTIINNTNILNNIYNRNLYKLKYEENFKIEFPKNKFKINNNEIIQELKLGLNNKNINPIDNIQFYKENIKVVLDKNQVSHLISESNTEYIIRIFTKKNNGLIKEKKDII